MAKAFLYSIINAFTISGRFLYIPYTQGDSLGYMLTRLSARHFNYRTRTNTR